jgi:hypothetical protein
MTRCSAAIAGRGARDPGAGDLTRAPDLPKKTPNDIPVRRGATPITPQPMTEPSPRPDLPDHLSIDPSSPFFVAAVFEHDVGIRFNDKERLDVEEYCISEGWVKVPAGKTLDRRGKPLLIKLKGRVEAFYR